MLIDSVATGSRLLAEAAAAFQSAKISEFHLEDGEPQVLYVPVGTMKTADSYINVTAMRDKHYVSLCHVLGLPELIDDERFNTRDKRVAREKELMPLIRAEFLKRTTAEWVALLTEADVMNAPIRNYGDYLANEHVGAVDSYGWIEHDAVGRMPVANIPGLPKIDGADDFTESPHVGEHSTALLREAGLGDGEIKALPRRDQGACERRQKALATRTELATQRGENSEKGEKTRFTLEPLKRVEALFQLR